MIKLALPKGRLQAKTAQFLGEAQVGIKGYSENSRNYRLTSKKFPNLRAKMFQERDIAIQVAIGNYDLGICGFNWVEELTSKFPSSGIVIIKGLGYGKGKLCVAASNTLGINRPEELGSLNKTIALASENPNLAEAYAAKLRLKRFKVFSVWGSAEVYPSFGADVAIFPLSSPASLDEHNLTPLEFISSREAFLIANKKSWESVNLGRILDLLCQARIEAEEEPVMLSLTDKVELRDKREAGRGVRTSNFPFPTSEVRVPTSHFSPLTSEALRIALPDGHQQKHTMDLLNRAGIKVAGYNVPADHPLGTNLEDVLVKVIRPQDMPIQVANGNIDLAITGRDWLWEHLYAFSSSPVKELLDLKFGRVKLVAVIANDVGVKGSGDLKAALYQGKPRPLRVASEYVNIADKYCRDKRLGHYKVIPTWGATEAFLPEDADLLIENTETGETLARHNLKVLDIIFESSACLIGSTREIAPKSKHDRIASIMKLLAKVV